MNIKEYLSKFNDESILNIVGPMAKLPETLPEPVVYVDAGAFNMMDGVGFSVGDNDSYDKELDEILCVDKNYSDLSYVLSHIVDSFSEVRLIGFLGGRRDHELMNLMETHQALKKSTKQVKYIFDSIIWGYSHGNWKKDINGVFSLISFEQISIQLDGACKYKISSEDKFNHLSSNGLSNTANGLVNFKSSAPFFVILVDD